MVSRHEIIPHTTSLCVVDLDGTYIKGNSLKIYSLCGLKYCAKHLHLSAFLKVLALIVLRKFRLISHETMKFDIFKNFKRYPGICNQFTKIAVKQINPKVEEIINTCKFKGYRVLLATAAPDFYVEKIWSGDFVATQYSEDKINTECKGYIKLKQVNDWCSVNNCNMKIVMTDHLDDVPLLCANSNGINILVNPNKNTLRFFRQLQPTKFFLIDDINKLGVTF